jgi:hypothetical protein
LFSSEWVKWQVKVAGKVSGSGRARPNFGQPIADCRLIGQPFQWVLGPIAIAQVTFPLTFYLKRSTLT